MRIDHPCLAWDALLQQELGRLDARVGVEAVDHPVAEQDVGDGHSRRRRNGDRTAFDCSRQIRKREQSVE